ncbi:MAG: pyridoxal phosphate-dependent decarboxylase family protein [Ruminococcus sp.]
MNRKTQKQNKEIGALMKDFTERAVDFYDHLDTRPVFHAVPEETLARLGSQEIPAHGRPIQTVYSEMLRDIYANTLLSQHPRSFACIPSTASLLSWMGDAMTSAFNPHASCQMNAPAAGLIEKKLIRWMCGLAGYPSEGGGLFVSGGSIANLTALTAARDTKLTFEERSRAVVYLSDQTHSSVSKALKIIGFSKEQLRIIPTDKFFRMDVSALQTGVKEDLAIHKKPFAVIASAGTTNTGSIDPLMEISAVCREYGMWLHVDGAFGASALLSPKYKKNLSGIEHSDSLSWDAHKWLSQTYGCSVVLVRSQGALIRSFAAHPEYLKDAEISEGDAEFWDLGPELTRPARALKLWLTLQTLGTDEMGRIIEHGCAMARLAEKLLSQSPEWEIISPAQLGIVNFRYRSDGSLPEEQLDEINQEISRTVTNSGFAQIFTTQLEGRKVLRMCTINPETTKKDIYDTIRLMKSKILCYRETA